MKDFNGVGKAQAISNVFYFSLNLFYSIENYNEL